VNDITISKNCATKNWLKGYNFDLISNCIFKILQVPAFPENLC